MKKKQLIGLLLMMPFMIAFGYYVLFIVEVPLHVVGFAFGGVILMLIFVHGLGLLIE